jgi:phenylacetate-coenzyme A ligase PaaK-like adenylate-forming protein
MTLRPSIDPALRLAQRTNPFLRRYRNQLAENESRDEGELLSDAERRLRGLIKITAARSAHYREVFASAGIDPRSIRSVGDLESLPMLRRADLVEQPERFLTIPRAFVRAARTSGTTGEPATCFRTAGSIIFELASLERQLRWFGLRPPLRSVAVRDEFADPEGKQLTRILGPGMIQVSPRALNPRTLPALMRRIERFKPEMVEGWPSRLAEFAQSLLDAGRTLPVAAVRTSSEPIFPAQRALFEASFGGALIDFYGQTERVAMGGTCEHGSFHLFTDYGIVELMRTSEGSDRFEVVATPLHNWGFPLLRYGTGDFVGTAEACRCGRPFPVVTGIEGRLETLVQAADGRSVPLASAVLDDLVGVLEARLVQHRPGVFEIQVVPGRAFVREALESQIKANISRIIGPGQTAKLTILPAAERGNGRKRSAVVVRQAGERGN